MHFFTNATYGGSPHAGLLDLPNELLLAIMGQGLSIELYHLACCSRRLNHLALPIFLARHRIPYPTEESNIIFPTRQTTEPRKIDSLAALQISISIASVKKLSCRFPAVPHSPFYPAEQLERLSRLVQRLERVEEVTLIMDGRDRYMGLTGDDAMLAHWSGLFGGLLNLLLERSCKYLCVRNGTFLTQTYELCTSEKLNQSPLCSALVQGMAGSMMGPGWQYRRVPDQGKEVLFARVTPQARLACTLEELVIQSPILLLPPCSHWTLSAMECSPITRLAFSKVVLTTAIWSVTLPCIAKALGTRLCELSIDTCPGISPEALMDFLAELPELRILKLDRSLSVVHPTMANSLRHPVLPRLHTLDAPSDYIAFLLRCYPFPPPAASPSSSSFSDALPPPPPPALPNLSSVCTDPRQSTFSNFNIVDAMSVLAPMMDAIRGCSHVALNVYLGVSCSAGMIRDVHAITRMQQPGVASTILASSSSHATHHLLGRALPAELGLGLGPEPEPDHHHHHHRYYPDLDMDLEPLFRFYRPKPGDDAPAAVDLRAVAAVCGRIRTLTVNDFSVCHDNLALLGRWLAPFAGLKELVLTWPVTPGAEAEAEADAGGSAPGAEGEETVIVPAAAGEEEGASDTMGMGKGKGVGELERRVGELLALLAADCPWMKRVVVGGHLYEL